MTFGTDGNESIRTVDGLRLAGTVVEPEGACIGAAVLVHGAGVTREEGGFFTRLADSLAEAGVASLRFDLPGHGASEGRQEDLSLSALLNVIRSAIDHVHAMIQSPTPIALISASFSGGISAYYAAKRPEQIGQLVLLNPLVDYQQRFVDEKPAWLNGYINEKGGRQLLEQGYVGHSPTFKLGRPILNEIFWLHPRQALGKISAPTLIVHGSADTFIPVQSSITAEQELTSRKKILVLDGAQHGFAVHDDPNYLNPQTQTWQALVIQEVCDWIITT